MNLKHNELPEVNHYIKEHNLKPCFEERYCGSLYNETDDITYIIVYDDNTYISYSSYFFANLEVVNYSGLLVTCRGKIHE